MRVTLNKGVTAGGLTGIVISCGPHKCCNKSTHTHTPREEHPRIKRKKQFEFDPPGYNCKLWPLPRTETIYFLFSLSVDSFLLTAAVLILPPALLLSSLRRRPPSLPFSSSPPSCPVGCDDALTGLASVLGGAGIFVPQRRGLVQE